MFEDAKGTVLERFGPESQSHVEKWERDGKEYPFGLLCPPPPAFPPSPASLSYVPLLLPSLISNRNPTYTIYIRTYAQ